MSQFISASEKVVITKNVCPVAVTITDVQVNQLAQRLNEDAQRVNLYTEFFSQARDQQYAPTICNHSTQTAASPSKNSQP